MNPRTPFLLEPFAEAADDAYRFGYRTVGTIDAVSMVEVPAPVVEQIVLIKASLTTRLAPNGTVISRASMSHAAGSVIDSFSETMAIDDLVQRAIDKENLRMEEATVGDLRILLQNLERSVILVKDAIDLMTGVSKASS
jgi:hypothetical protein